MNIFRFGKDRIDLSAEPGMCEMGRVTPIEMELNGNVSFYFL
jgi:hypothetical protein